MLAIEALEREVDNGGYWQFFINASVEFVPAIVGALQRIGGPQTAGITERAIAALGMGADVSPAAVEARMGDEDPAREEALGTCDRECFASGEDIAGRLFEYLKQNRSTLSLP